MQVRSFSFLETSVRWKTGNLLKGSNTVAVGETSLLLRVAAAHRGAAFEASRWTVDELKKRVPIWKSVRFQAGSAREKERSVPALA